MVHSHAAAFINHLAAFIAMSEPHKSYYLGHRVPPATPFPCIDFGILIENGIEKSEKKKNWQTTAESEKGVINTTTHTQNLFGKFDRWACGRSSQIIVFLPFIFIFDFGLARAFAPLLCVNVCVWCNYGARAPASTKCFSFLFFPKYARNLFQWDSNGGGGGAM